MTLFETKTKNQRNLIKKRVRALIISMAVALKRNCEETSNFLLPFLAKLDNVEPFETNFFIQQKFSLCLRFTCDFLLLNIFKICLSQVIQNCLNWREKAKK